MATRFANSIAIPTKRVERDDLRQWTRITVGVVILAILGFIFVGQSSAVSTLGYDIQRLESEKKLCQAKNEQLQLQISQLKSLDRVEKEAASRLGMSRPTTVLYANQVDTGTLFASSKNSGVTSSVNTTKKSDGKAGQEGAGAGFQLFPFSQRPLDTEFSK